MCNTVRCAQIVLIVAIACSSFNCAVQQPPGGGPRDLTPPTVIESFPEHNTINFHERVITIAFDKYVDKRAAQDAFFISPALHGKPEFSWSGKKLTITLPDSLRPNTTYTISLGTDVFEIRENIHLAKPYTLSFSTGASVDSASINGRVYCESTSGVFVFAYQLNGRNIDTLNASHTPPDFLAPVAKDSTFTIPALPFGNFRLIAIKDELRNLVYDVGTDAFCTAQHDLHLDSLHNKISGVQFHVAQTEDTVPPELTGADAITTRHVRVNFSEPLDSTFYSPARFLLRDSLTHTPVVVRSAIPSSKRTSVEIYCDALTPDALYLCAVDSLRDIAGNLMHKGATAFTATTKIDTSAPVAIFPFRDSTRDISEGKFIFQFDKPLQHKLAENGVRLSDSLRQNIPLRFRWPNDAMMILYDDKQRENQWYNLTVTVNFFADELNNHTKDSVVHLRFHTRDPRTLGALKGTIEDSANTTHAGYYISARNVDTKKTITKRIGDAGPFLLDELPDGTYTVDAFRDDDNNGVLSPGHVFPSKPAEPYTALRGTFRVRARWTVEGIVIGF